MQSLGKVYTFAVGAPATLAAVAQSLQHYGIEGATLLQAEGFWKGAREHCTLVQIAGRFERDSEAKTFARALGIVHGQEAIYFERAGEAFLEYTGLPNNTAAA